MWIGTGNGATYYRDDTFHKVILNTAVQNITGAGSDSIILATTDGLQLYHNEESVKMKTGGAADSSTPQCLSLIHI